MGMRAGGGLLSLVALSGGGCATDWGIRRAPTLEEIGHGVLAIGAAVGAGIGIDALADAGGGGDVDSLFWPQQEWPDRGW